MTCTHFWVLTDATQPQSHATCKLCGATKVFENYAPTSFRANYPERPVSSFVQRLQAKRPIASQVFYDSV
jgi:hypothetical protein